jgi:endonuclease/exonuclease/phosphatase family metal-dependent hydrolase
MRKQSEDREVHRVPLIAILGHRLGSVGSARRWLRLLGLVGLCLLGVYVMSLFGGEPSAPFLRVMTYNIEGLHVDEERLLTFLQDHRPDLLLLQEVRGSAQLQRLAQRLELPHWHFEPYHGRRVGIGMLSRWPLGQVRVLTFRAGKQGKLALAAPVYNPHQTVWVCTLHFEAHRRLREKTRGIVPWGVLMWRELFSDTVRYRQARELRAWLQKRAGTPLIVGGDFNSFPFARVDRYLSNFFHDALRSRPWRYFSGTYWKLPQAPFTPRIDFLYHSSELRVRAAYVIQYKVSDHYPVLAVLTLPDRRPKQTASWRQLDGPLP